jgi:N-acetylmuramic acid 6-phosphate etherase
MNTERLSQRYRDVDSWSDADILDAFWEGQARAIAAVRPALPAIATAVQAIVQRIEPNGRIIYAGAGSSGQQAALDGMELRATFGWPTERVVYLLAERRKPVSSLVGNQEDDAVRARAVVRELRLTEADVFIAVAASGTTPFTLSAAEAARNAKALVLAIANNPEAPLFSHAEHRILWTRAPKSSPDRRA